jgi:hypothetical protein
MSRERMSMLRFTLNKCKYIELTIHTGLQGWEWKITGMEKLVGIQEMNTPAPAAKDPALTTNGPTQQVQPKGMSVLRQHITPALDMAAPTNKESALANEPNSAPNKGPTTTATPATERSAPTAIPLSTHQYIGPNLVGKGTSQEECSAENIMP